VTAVAVPGTSVWFIGLLVRHRLSAEAAQRQPGSVLFVPARCCDPEGVVRLASLAQERCPDRFFLNLGPVADSDLVHGHLRVVHGDPIDYPSFQNNPE
jgi:hypothetical protein